MKPESQRTLLLLRARGRCTGAMIFSAFGGCWLIVGMVFLGRFSLVWAGLLGGFALLLAVVAFRLEHSLPEPVLDENLISLKKKDDRRFWIVNAVTYTAVFLMFPTLSMLKLEDYILPGFVGLVGLHFFPMPQLYQHTANRITGACLIVWAVSCVFIFRPDGDRIAASVSFGAGALLWASAGFAMITAKKLSRRSEFVSV